MIVSDVDPTAVMEPETPVTVICADPGVALLLSVSVMMLEPVVGFGEKEAVTPLGRPEAESVTFPVKPYWGFTVTVPVCVVPGLALPK